jgi:hypothetical protein
MGGESFHPEILKATRKGVTVAQYEEAAREVIDIGMKVSFAMMLGHPLDSDETLAETYRRIEALPPEAVINGFQFLRPLPETQVERECLELGLLKNPLTYQDFIYARNHPLMPTLHLSEKALVSWMARFNELLVKREADRKDAKLEGPKLWFSRFKNLGRSGVSTLGSKIKGLSSKNDNLKQVRSLSPNNIRLYEHLLSFYKLDPRVEFVAPAEIYSVNYPNKVTVSLRHDVDFYPDKIELLTQVEEKLGLRSVVYVVFDNSHYEAEKYGELFRELDKKGFAIGLHTLAPAARVPLIKFAEERDLFKEVLGQYPKFFTVHGISPHPDNWVERVSTFRDEIELHRTRWGLYPCSQGYHGLRAIQDSGDGGEFGFLKEEFFRIHEFPPGTNIELLTHPEHWVEHPVPWSVDEKKRFSWFSLIKD